MQNVAQNRVDVTARKLGSAERDFLTLGIAFTAIIMFVGTGGEVLPQVVQALTGKGFGPDKMLVNAMLLNIALIVFGWRRYRELGNESAERRMAEAQSRVLAETDALTGCLNRRSIGAATQGLIDSAAARGQAVAMILLDLDNFRQVNDLYSHSAGDALLDETASRIRAVLPAGALLARIGGDEFACAVPFDPDRRESVDHLTERLIDAVAAPVAYNGNRIEATVSAGLTRSDGENGNVAQTLLHVAEIALHQAKKQGRNRHLWFDPGMESELRLRSELENGIRRGVAAGEFVPYFEKQIDLSTGDLVGFEMLARWNSPSLGVVNPDIFIPVAEEIGLIADLSENIIRQALDQARGWDPRLTLSVNISPVQLRDPWFAQKILKLLVEANFPPSRFEIEITESCLHENIGLVRSLISSLKNQGVRVSLDDFGTGYSSLAQLRTLPFDRIKIDRSFVTTLPTNSESATIVQSIVSLGEGLGLPITAEGIENEAVLAELARFSNLKGQGYLYGRPATAEATGEELAQLDLLLEMPEPPAARRTANG